MCVGTVFSKLAHALLLVVLALLSLNIVVGNSESLENLLLGDGVVLFAQFVFSVSKVAAISLNAVLRLLVVLTKLCFEKVEEMLCSHVFQGVCLRVHSHGVHACASLR
jgi:hypothetical protein